MHLVAFAKQIKQPPGNVGQEKIDKHRDVEKSPRKPGWSEQHFIRAGMFIEVFFCL